MPMIDIDAHPGIAPSLINLRVLAACVLFASKDETKYYLNGVMVDFDEKGATYVATDGARLVCYRDELMGETKNFMLGSFIIPAPHCKVFKLDKDDDGYGKAFPQAERLTIAHGFVDITFAPIDGEFPAWHRVVPKAPASGEIAQFNLPLLADFQKFALAIGVSAPFVASNGEGPAPIWFPGYPHVMGLMMPHKSTDELGRTAPDWVKRRSNSDQGDIEDFMDGNVETLRPKKGA
jgi:hypothetical protein